MSWFGRRSRRRRKRSGLGASDKPPKKSVFDFLTPVIDAPSILKTERESIHRARGGGAVACEDLHEFLIKTSLFINSGTREPPNKTQLLQEIADHFGVENGRWVVDRCKQHPFVNQIARMERYTFTCDDLKTVMQSLPPGTSTLKMVKPLQERTGNKIERGTILSALQPDGRCGHLRSLWHPRKGGREATFTCEEIEALMEKHQGYGRRTRIAEDLGISDEALRQALLTRCSHLSFAGQSYKFTCDDLEVLLKKYKGAFGSQTKIARELGVSTGRITETLDGRCKHLKPLAAGRTKFTCDDLEEVMKTAPDHATATLAAMLAKRVGQTVSVPVVGAALSPKGRCSHLRAVLRRPPPKRSEVRPKKFTCEELAPLVEKYRGRRGAYTTIGKALNVSDAAIRQALKTRCKHLGML